MKASGAEFAVPPLSGGGVHVWRLIAGSSGSSEEAYRSFLDPDERARLARYRFAEDRAMFGAGRAALRVLIGRYAGIAPAAVRLVLSARGQPLPGPASAAAGLMFSVSHSGGRVLLAFTSGIAVGVDVEQIRPEIDIEGIVRRHFASLEAEAVLSLPADVRPHAFFAAWTRKEAFLKARGEGLTSPLDSFTVTVEPDGPPRLLRPPPGVGADEWSIRDLEAGRGFRAALAARHPSPRVSVHDLPDSAFRLLGSPALF